MTYFGGLNKAPCWHCVEEYTIQRLLLRNILAESLGILRPLLANEVCQYSSWTNCIDCNPMLSAFECCRPRQSNNTVL